MKPADIRVALEPGHLFAGVDAGILLDFLYGKVQCPFAVQILEKFFVAHGVQRVVVLMGIDAAGFFQQSVGHHLVDTAVDAVVEFLTIPGQTHLDNAEGTLFSLPGAEGSISLARHVADFEGVDDTFGILQVHNLIVFGIEQTKLGTQTFEAFFFVAAQHQRARFAVDGRNVIDAFADGVDIHHGTSSQHYGIFFLEQGFEQFYDFGFVLSGTVVVGQSQCTHKIVFHPL